MSCPVVIKGQKNILGASLEKQTDVLYCGRCCNMGGWKLPTSKWHNPFTVKQFGLENVILYEQYVRSDGKLISEIGELSGKKLACFCAPSRCHCDLLVKI